MNYELLFQNSNTFEIWFHNNSRLRQDSAIITTTPSSASGANYTNDRPVLTDGSRNSINDEGPATGTAKRLTWFDVIYPPKQCAARLSIPSLVCLAIASAVWLWRFFKYLSDIYSFSYIRNFYTTINISNASALNSTTWNDIQKRLIERQKRVQYSVNDPNLDELSVLLSISISYAYLEIISVTVHFLF